MSEPFVFVSTHRLKEGMREPYKEYTQDFVAHIEPLNPHLRVLAMYLDEAGEHVSVVQVHDTPESMATHMRNAHAHIGEAYDSYLDETVWMHIYGNPTPDVIAMMEQLAGTGVPISVNRPFAGFDRLTAEAQPQGTG